MFLEGVFSMVAEPKKRLLLFPQKYLTTQMKDFDLNFLKIQ